MVGQLGACEEATHTQTTNICLLFGQNEYSYLNPTQHARRIALFVRRLVCLTLMDAMRSLVRRHILYKIRERREIRRILHARFRAPKILARCGDSWLGSRAEFL